MSLSPPPPLSFLFFFCSLPPWPSGAFRSALDFLDLWTVRCFGLESCLCLRLGPFRFFADFVSASWPPGFWHTMRTFYDGDAYPALGLYFKFFDVAVSYFPVFPLCMYDHYLTWVF